MKTKRILALALAVLMSFGLVETSYAANPENDVLPCFNYMASCSAAIAKEGSGLIAGASVHTYDDVTVNITLGIEKYVSGNWEPHITLSVTSIDEGIVRGVEETLVYAPSGNYRTIAKIRIVNDNGTLLESETVYSQSVIIP